MSTSTSFEILDRFFNRLKLWSSLRRVESHLGKRSNAYFGQQLLLDIQNLDTTSPTLANDLVSIEQNFHHLSDRINLFNKNSPYEFLYSQIIAARIASEAIIITGNIPSIPHMTVHPTKIADHNIHFFAHTTPTNNAEHLLYINFKNSLNANFTTGIQTTSELPLRYLSITTLPNCNFLATNHTYIMTDSSITEGIERIDATLLMSLSLNGKPFHEKKIYTGQSTIRTFATPLLSESNEQFSDVLQVLSEANMTDDIIDKFLRLYQVLENFMVRRQIINVIQTSSLSHFSIKEFKRLYKSVEEAEQKSVNDLIKAAMNDTCASNGKTLKQHIIDRWSNLNQSQKTTIIDSLKILNKPDIKDTTFEASLRSSSDELGTSIYRTRCSIVHNKEHEFHLTHMSLTSKHIECMNLFLIPSMEDIIFHLLAVNKSIIWYQMDRIKLY